MPRYTIHCAPDKVTEVLAWMARGITVRQSQYIGDGSTVFQPADNAGQPHWKYGEVIDTLTASETTEFISVVSVESHYDAFLPAPCRYCDNGTHHTNPALESSTASMRKCKHCGLHLGFSFTESWHHGPNGAFGRLDNSQCGHVFTPGSCWVCNGTGQGARYLSEMEPKKERKAAIARLESEGWKVWYQRRGQLWRMERENVVKAFGQEVSQ